MATVQELGTPPPGVRWEAHVGGGLTAMAWAPDGEVLAVATREGQVLLLDGERGSQLALLTEHGTGPVSLAWRRCGSLLVTSGADGTIRCHARATLDLLAELDAGARADGVAWSTDGAYVAARVGGLPSVWAVAECSSMRVVRRTAARAIAWHPTERRLLGVDAGRVWSLPLDGARAGTLRSESPLLGLAVRSDGVFVAATTLRGVAVWDLVTGVPRIVPRDAERAEGPVRMAFCTGTDWFAASRGRNLAIWDLRHGADRLGTWFQGHDACVTGLVSLPRGRGFVSTGDDGAVHVWPAGATTPSATVWTGRALRLLAGGPQSTIATASADHRVVAWNV